MVKTSSELSVERFKRWGMTLPQLCMEASPYTHEGRPVRGWAGAGKPTLYLRAIHTHLEETIEAWEPLRSAANPRQHMIDCCVFALAMATRNYLEELLTTYQTEKNRAFAEQYGGRAAAAHVPTPIQNLFSSETRADAAKILRDDKPASDMYTVNGHDVDPPS